MSRCSGTAPRRCSARGLEGDPTISRGYAANYLDQLWSAQSTKAFVEQGLKSSSSSAFIALKYGGLVDGDFRLRFALGIIVLWV